MQQGDTERIPPNNLYWIRNWNAVSAWTYDYDDDTLFRRQRYGFTGIYIQRTGRCYRVSFLCGVVRTVHACLLKANQADSAQGCHGGGIELIAQREKLRSLRLFQLQLYTPPTSAVSVPAFRCAGFP